ncbi:MAG: alpha/beta hydrolase [Chloroflexi bacterium]|nr:alpha/beta hydrolase [Chloroflexota bacterium]
MTTRLLRRPLRSLWSIVLVAALALSVFVATGAAAAADYSTQPKPTIVLVHGAWADSSSWSRVIERLQRLGYTVLAPANPLRSLQSDSTYISSILAQVSGPIVLVGHSYGGMVITNAANGNTNVKALVYVSAFIPEQGENAFGLVGKDSHIVPPGTPGQTANLTPLGVPPFPPTNFDLYINPANFRDIFAADVPQEQTSIMAVTQRPATVTSFSEQSGAPAWTSIPASAILGGADHAIGTNSLLTMAKRLPGGRVVEIPGASHALMVSHPDAVTAFILAALQSIH